MMIGAENGRKLITTASWPVGLVITGCTKMMLNTNIISTGCAACCASSCELTIAPTAAKSDA